MTLVELHPAITFQAVHNAVWRRIMTLDNPGFCIKCGNEQGGCEPDAREYICEGCGTPTVYGADELLVEIEWPAA